MLLALAAAANLPAQTHALKGTVSGPDGPVTGATVTLTGTDSTHPDRLIAGAAGRGAEYIFGGVTPGQYRISVHASGFTMAEVTAFTMPADHDVIMSFALAPAADRNAPEIAMCGILLALYFLAIVGARWFSIARPNQELLRESLDALETRMATETMFQPSSQWVRAALAKLKKTVEDARRNYVYDRRLPWRERRKQPAWPSLLDRIFWSGSKENAGWSAIHSVERELVAFLAPEARVFVRLGTAEQQLREINRPPATALAETIRTTLDRRTGLAASRVAIDQAREMLAAAIEIVNSSRDARFFLSPSGTARPCG